MLPPNVTTYDAQYVERHSRLTTFFRLLLLIPHAIVLWVFGLVAGIAVVIAWFAILVTGRYPSGLYDFVAGYLRYYGRYMGYGFLITDQYPPFSLQEEPQYPVALEIGPPMAKYNRLLTFLRLILLIPVAIVIYVLNMVAGVLVVVAWFVILITGRMPQGLHGIIMYCVSYQMRGSVYGALLTEAFPAFDGTRDATPGADIYATAPYDPGAQEAGPPDARTSGQAPSDAGSFDDGPPAGLYDDVPSDDGPPAGPSDDGTPEEPPSAPGGDEPSH